MVAPGLLARGLYGEIAFGLALALIAGFVIAAVAYIHSRQRSRWAFTVLWVMAGVMILLGLEASNSGVLTVLPALLTFVAALAGRQRKAGGGTAPATARAVPI
jgi:uncharacterized membrane protein YoaK (UPF0700 family)